MLAQSAHGNIAEPTRRVLEQIIEFVPSPLAAIALVLIGLVDAQPVGTV